MENISLYSANIKGFAPLFKAKNPTICHLQKKGKNAKKKNKGE